MPDNMISWGLRKRIAFDISSGMAYLHSRVPPIVHRDLRSPNIFLCSQDENDSVVAKVLLIIHFYQWHSIFFLTRMLLFSLIYQVADFGLSTFVAHKVGGALKTWNWMPPEALQEEEGGNEIQYDERLDVYSFAIVLWEIATRRYPFEEDYAEKFMRNRAFDDRACRNAVISDQLRPPIDASSPPPFCQEPDQWRMYCEIMCDCWRHHPSDRPKFSDITKRLELLNIPGSREARSLRESSVGSEYIQEIPDFEDEDTFKELKLAYKV